MKYVNANIRTYVRSKQSNQNTYICSVYMMISLECFKLSDDIVATVQRQQTMSLNSHHKNKTNQHQQ